MEVKCLDNGFVVLKDKLGDDLTVVNSARVSFNKQKELVDESDEKLIHYLAKHKHYSPFRHVQLQFHCKVPEFVARQWYKHVVGATFSDSATVDHAWNEISMRYVDLSKADFHLPEEFRKQADDKKQGSSSESVNENQMCIGMVEDHNYTCLELYERLIKEGVCREQARMVLPLNIYTEFYWTASLQAVANFIKLRQHEGAQYEIREYASALEQLCRSVVPVSTEALLA